MSDEDPQGKGKLGFLDSLGRLFRREPAAPPAPARPESAGFTALEASFESAIGALQKRIEEERREVRRMAPGGMSAQDLGAERERRKEAAQRAMRDDIEKMHANLDTGLASADLDELVRFLSELDAISRAGRGSRSLVPRARRAVAERLRREAGELTVASLVARLQRKNLGWPDPTQSHPGASPEEIEASRRRRLGTVRESFLAYDLARMGERLQGIVWGWGGDYPDRGSLLWQEVVLEGVAAGLWARMLRDFVEMLQQHRDELLSRTEATVGKELGALHAALERGSSSIEQTTEAVASSLRVLDEVVPEVAWKIVCAHVPEARGAVESVPPETRATALRPERF